MNEKENSLRTIFVEATEIADAVKRAAFLRRACGDDAALCQRLERLLKAHADAGGMTTTEAVSNGVLPVTEKPGDRIGRYKLREQIGEGGCGVVYVAEQEEPVRRRVALKVIKLGMDTRQVVARFEAERQALAMMDHPNIAKVFDAGATDTGRPYFVMELVRGIKITDYCDQNKLSTQQRLDLFIQVCHALQHAHQKGIIHRDIKPSNILVTPLDGRPVPKVIDFGIAKATEGRLTDLTVYTELNQFIGTPAYMSPEQAGMSGLDIDTRSDIYSLGVLLYELLTGRTPFDAKALLQAGLDQMRRIIREQEPVKPSTRLSTLAHADLAEVARHRQAEAPKLIHVVRGDLDWIVMKALEKDRTRRYDTANGLAMDIERHVHNEPVLARPPSNLYRFQKLVRRNKFAFAAAGAVAVALIIGLGISTWLFFREREAVKVANDNATRASTETAKATAISDFLQQLLRSANPDALKGSEYTVRQLLDDFSAGLAIQLKDQPEVEAAVRATIGRAYFRLGVADKAQAHHERALTLRRRSFGEQSEPVAESLLDYAWTCFEQGQYAKGEPYVREALEIYRKRGTAGQPVIYALWASQRILIAQSRFAEVEAVLEEAVSIARKSPTVEFPDIASMIHGLADVKNGQSQYAEAELLALKAVAMHRRLRGAEHPETGWALVTVGVALRGQQKLADAEAALREALRIFRKYHSSRHNSVDAAMNELKLVFAARGDSAAVEALYREVLAGQRAKLGDDSPAVAASLHDLARSLREQGKLSEAETLDREALAIWKRPGNENPETVESLISLAWELHLRGQPAEAEAHAALTAARKVFGMEHRVVGTALERLGTALLDQGKHAEAEAMFRDAVELRRKVLGEHADTAHSLAWLAGALEGQGKIAAAEAATREVLEIRKKLPGNESWVAGSLGYLATLLQKQGKTADAETVLREALALKKEFLGNEPPDVANTLHKLGDLLRDSGKWGEAEETFREVVAVRRKLFGNEHLDLGHSLHGLAWVLNHNGKRAEAETLSREELAIRRKRLGNDHAEVAFTLEDLSVFLRDQGKLAAAESTAREVLAMRRKLLGDAHPDVARSLRNLAGVLGPQGKYVEAEAMYGEALAMQRKLHGDEHRDVDDALGNLADCLQAQGKLAEAEEVRREELAVERKLSGKEHPFVANSLNSLAAVLRDQGKLLEAESVIREALAMRRKLQGNDDPDLAATLAELTSILLAGEKSAEAEPLARESLAIREKKLPDDWRTFNAHALLGRALLGQKRFAEAEPLLLSGYEGMKQREAKIPTVGKPRLKETVQRLVELYEATNRPEKTAEWKGKLAEFDKAETEQKAAATKP